VRPVLIPAARRLWRDKQTLQVGRPSRRAVVVHGLDATRRLVLPLLDGSRTREQVITLARDQGCHDAQELLELLEDGGLLLDADTQRPPGLDRAESDRLSPDLASLALVHGRRAAQALQARHGARVVVHGGGRVGAPLAALLAAAGVGTVDVRDNGAVRVVDTGVGGVNLTDLGRTRADAINGRLRSLGSARHPALVILTDHGAETTAAVLQQSGTPHLLARVEEHVGVVGPLVLPGSSPCLRCLELVRIQLDPGWPALATQLSRPARSPEACDGVLAVAVAAQAALQALQLLDGGSPGSIGGTLELELPGWRWRRRTWPQHPGCPCAWAADVAVPA
jgi:bacteriocin biosynthesis cyclodehydratase domain-containing protein